MAEDAKAAPKTDEEASSTGTLLDAVAPEELEPTQADPEETQVEVKPEEEQASEEIVQKKQKVDPSVYDNVGEIKGYDTKMLPELLGHPRVQELKQLAAEHELPPEVFQRILEIGVAAFADELSVDVDAELKALGPQAHKRIAAAATLVRHAVGVDHPIARVVLSTASGIEFVEKLIAAARPSSRATVQTQPMSLSDIQEQIDRLVGSADYKTSPAVRERVERLIALKLQIEAAKDGGF